MITVLLFVYYKLRNTNENLEFQDFIIEKFFGGSAKKSEEIKAEAFVQKKADLPINETAKVEMSINNESSETSEWKAEAPLDIPAPVVAPAFELS